LSGPRRHPASDKPKTKADPAKGSTPRSAEETNADPAKPFKQLTRTKAAPTVKQHLAGIRMLIDWLTSGGILSFNPAASVRGPKYSVKRGKTPG
jgi:hypothetical protein